MITYLLVDKDLQLFASTLVIVGFTLSVCYFILGLINFSKTLKYKNTKLLFGREIFMPLKVGGIITSGNEVRNSNQKGISGD
ncbi:hypothetical protein ABE24_17280 [Cytobacillus firmus]|nr:hypothetical protein [Cytobacillus firmus]MBG9656489.1 hypothetical protein [Cytobacillus firmus]